MGDALAALGREIGLKNEDFEVLDEVNAFAGLPFLQDVRSPAQRRARGHIHTSLTAVDAMLSGASVRAEMTAGIRRLLTTPAMVG